MNITFNMERNETSRDNAQGVMAQVWDIHQHLRLVQGFRTQNETNNGCDTTLLGNQDTQ